MSNPKRSACKWGNPRAMTRDELVVSHDAMTKFLDEQNTKLSTLSVCVKAIVHDRDSLRRERDSLINHVRASFGCAVTFTRKGLAVIKRGQFGSR